MRRIQEELQMNETYDTRNEILILKEEHNATILAHNYQKPEVQDVADLVGDSLELSRAATRVDTEDIIVCGVDFIAETRHPLTSKRGSAAEKDAWCRWPT